jgi:hypothetical protein
VVAEIRDGSVPAITAAASAERPVVLATNFVTADFIPTVTAARPLWNPHTSSAGGVNVAENKRLFYLYLYYSGLGSDLSSALKANSFEVTSAIFGAERALPSLGDQAAKITPQEIQAEVTKYTEFVRNFDAKTAASPTLDYVIVPTEAEPAFTEIDRWYTRDAGQAYGLLKVYKLTPKEAM